MAASAPGWPRALQEPKPRRRIRPIALSAEICDQVASQAALNRRGGLTL